jgi:hypothetical protein
MLWRPDASRQRQIHFTCGSSMLHLDLESSGSDLTLLLPDAFENESHRVLLSFPHLSSPRLYRPRRRSVPTTPLVREIPRYGGRYQQSQWKCPQRISDSSCSEKALLTSKSQKPARSCRPTCLHLLSLVPWYHCVPRSCPKTLRLAPAYRHTVNIMTPAAALTIYLKPALCANIQHTTESRIEQCMNNAGSACGGCRLVWVRPN